jgi:hypothetical protein
MKTTLLTAALLALVIYGCSGCSLTVSPDGTRTWALDGEEVARGIIIATESNK